MLATLADATTPLFVMREKEALTDPYQQIRAVVGSGPFMFVAEAFRDGDVVVYRKNPYAKPRPEPADGMAGGKVAKVDRVEWHILPDAGTAVSALRRGEVDLLETAPYDLLPVIEGDQGLTLTVTDPLGQQAVIRLNHLIAPFDDPNLRRALLLAVDQGAHLAAAVGDSRFERSCSSAFVCGTPSAAGAGPAGAAALEQAKALVAASAYRGEPIVVMDPTDNAILHPLTLVTIDRLATIGFKVDAQAMPWSQLVSRRVNRERPVDGRGGWHVFHTLVPSVALANPITNYLMATSCDGKNWFGWPCDPALERLRLSFLDATTPAQQEAVFRAMQSRFQEVVPFIPVGQLTKPVAHRKNVTGLVASPILAVWNVEKH